MYRGTDRGSNFVCCLPLIFRMYRVLTQKKIMKIMTTSKNDYSLNKWYNVRKRKAFKALHLKI